VPFAIEPALRLARAFEGPFSRTRKIRIETYANGSQGCKRMMRFQKEG
jgi:hypothetical protein